MTKIWAALLVTASWEGLHAPPSHSRGVSSEWVRATSFGVDAATPRSYSRDHIVQLRRRSAIGKPRAVARFAAFLITMAEAATAWACATWRTRWFARPLSGARVGRAIALGPDRVLNQDKRRLVGRDE